MNTTEYENTTGRSYRSPTGHGNPTGLLQESQRTLKSHRTGIQESHRTVLQESHRTRKSYRTVLQESYRTLKSHRTVLQESHRTWKSHRTVLQESHRTAGIPHSCPIGSHRSCGTQGDFFAVLYDFFTREGSAVSKITKLETQVQVQRCIHSTSNFVNLVTIGSPASSQTSHFNTMGQSIPDIGEDGVNWPVG